jgi:hypothetical protein
MKVELQEKLFKDFPGIFQGVYQKGSLMNFGIMTGDGWFDLIYKLCQDIDTVLKTNPNMQEINDFHFMEVKEKFGELRVYASGIRDSRISELISEAELASGTICEHCGRPGKINSGGWLSCMCNVCRARQAWFNAVRGNKQIIKHTKVCRRKKQ